VKNTLKKLMQVSVVCFLILNSTGLLSANEIENYAQDNLVSRTDGMQVIGETKSGQKVYRKNNEIKNFNAAESGDAMYWNGTYATPMIWMDNLGWVYCIEPYETYPNGEWYDTGTWLLDEGLDALLMWGFPRNHGGQHGLSDEDAYLRTFVALNAYIGTYNRQTVESYNDGYVNMLLAKADAKDVVTETYTVHEPKDKESYFNKDARRLETNLFEITGSGEAEYWLENLSNELFMIDEEGNRIEKSSIPSKFRLATNNLKYNGDVTFDVRTTIAPTGAIKFSAPSVQDLVGLSRRDPLPAYKASATFKPATGGFRGRKEDTNGSLVTGAVFTLFEDEAGTKVVQDVKDKDVTITTQNSLFEYPDDIVAGDYWLHERKPDGSSGAPNGYWELEKPIAVSIEAGQIIDLPVITNIFKERVQLVVKKMNEYNKPVPNLTFDVYRKGDDLLVDTIVTNGQGEASSKFLPANRINPTTGLEEKIEYYAVERQLETYIPIKYVDFPLETKNDDDQIIVELVNYHLRLSVEGFKVDEEQNVLPGTLYGMYDAEDRKLAVTEVDATGRFTFQNVRFDLFFNTVDKASKFADTYIQEQKTVDDDKYTLDRTKYYLPNLEGKFNDYEMDDVITLSTTEEPFINRFLRGIVELVKVDEQDNEKVLPNTTFRFERLTGRHEKDEQKVDEGEIKTDADEIGETTQPDIDIKQTFELTTDETGRIAQPGLLYGDWCVTEIQAPPGYVLPLDNNGTPNNQLCFTFNAETQKVSLKFYNQKKPELLVSTGNNSTGMF